MHGAVPLRQLFETAYQHYKIITNSECYMRFSEFAALALLVKLRLHSDWFFAVSPMQLTWKSARVVWL